MIAEWTRNARPAGPRYGAGAGPSKALGCGSATWSHAVGTQACPFCGQIQGVCSLPKPMQGSGSPTRQKLMHCHILSTVYDICDHAPVKLCGRIGMATMNILPIPVPVRTHCSQSEGLCKRAHGGSIPPGRVPPATQPSSQTATRRFPPLRTSSRPVSPPASLPASQTVRAGAAVASAVHMCIDGPCLNQGPKQKMP